jgi:hypothetical protein
LKVSENRELMKIFAPDRDEVIREWRRLHNKELYALYSSRNTIWVIKSRKLRWVVHVASMGERVCVYRVLVEKPEGMRSLEILILRWILEKLNGWHGLDSSGSG